MRRTKYEEGSGESERHRQIVRQTDREIDICKGRQIDIQIMGERGQVRWEKKKERGRERDKKRKWEEEEDGEEISDIRQYSPIWNGRQIKRKFPLNHLTENTI